MEIAGFKTPLPKNSANIIKIDTPTPITIPVKGCEMGQSFPSLAQLEIKIKRKDVKINSVNKVELILIDSSILISVTDILLALNPKTISVEPNICEMMYIISSNLDINFFENK